MNRRRRWINRVACLIAVAAIASETMLANVPIVRAASPEPTVQVEPSASPSPKPSPSASPAPSPSSTPAPSESPAPSPTADPTVGPQSTPGSTPITSEQAGPKPGATEILTERTDRSQTYDNHDGTRTTEFYVEPVFYKPQGAETYQPIELVFEATSADGLEAISDKAPISVGLADSTSADDFLRLSDGVQTIGFAMPLDLARDAVPATPSIDGRVADYRDFFPGIDLRVIANADGAKSFFIWHANPDDPTLRYVVDAPGLTLVEQEDGSISLVNAKGEAVASIPRPYAVDSTVDEQAGGGRYTDKVTLSLGSDGKTVTVAVDPAWLRSAVYPVYVDPSTGWVVNTGSTTYGDTFSASSYPTSNYANYQRPDSPYYNEMWNGLDPSGTSGTSLSYLKWSLSALNGSTVESATLALDPYHQYYDAPTVLNTYVRRVTELWYENTLNWNNAPTFTNTDYAVGACVEGDWCYWDVGAIVQPWLNGDATNYGFQIDNTGHGSTYWKRFVASEETSTAMVPSLKVIYHVPTVTDLTPRFTGTVAWSTPNVQTKFQVDVATDGTFATPVALSGQVTSAASSWRIQPNQVTPMVDDAVYSYRVRIFDGAWTTYAQGTFTYDAYLRGEETYYESVPLDLGGGLGLEIGTQNGEARLQRDLFSIPSYGPAGELSLTHSSLDPSGAGAFGTGWNSNLTQYLTFENGLVVWHRADGGRVAFSNATGSWLVQGGHFETLARGANDVITLQDQTKLTFQNASAGHLLSIANRFGKALTITGWGTSTVTATDAASRVTTLGFTGALITSATDSAGRAWAFTYTGTNLTKLRDPASKDTDFTYSGSKVATITRARTKAAGGTDSIVWAIGYTNGLVTSVTDPIGAATSGTPAHTFTTSASSTVAGLLRTYPATVIRNTTTYTLDGYGRSTAIRDPGGYTTKQTFNPDGTLKRIDRPVDLSPATWARTDYLYTAGNLTQETVGLDATSTGVPTDTIVNVMSYNATNDLLTRSEDDASSAVRVITLYKYASGHLTDVIENCTTTGTTPPTTASGCTGAGTHDASTNLTTTYTYTANDQVDVEWNPRGFATKHLYDANGNETSTIVNCTSTGATIPARNTSCTGAGTSGVAMNVTTSATFALATRDGKAGLPGTTTDALGAVTTNTYDVMGRQTVEALPGDATIPVLTRTTVFDEYDRALTVTESWTGLSPSRVTTSVYDLRGQLLTETNPAGEVTSWAYNAARDITNVTAKGIATVNLVDGLGNVVSDTVGGVTTAHSFNAMGVDVLRQPSGSQVVVTADALARPTRVGVAAAGSPPVVEVIIDKQTYDHLGHTKAYRVIGGSDVQQSDSVANRLGRQVSLGVGPAATMLVQTATFDANGNETASTAPALTGSGPMTTSTYDALDRREMVIANDVSIVTDPSSQDLITTTFYDAAGQVVATKDPLDVVTRTFYNVRGLPSKVVVNCTDTGTAAPSNPATCSGAGTASSSFNVVTTMTYDGAGSQVSSTQVLSSGSILTASTYDASRRLTKVVVDQGGLDLTTEYAFDSSGNEIAEKDPAGTITRTFYDAAGRVMKTVVNCTNVGTTPPSPWATCAGTGTVDGRWNVTSSSTYDTRGNKSSDTAPNGRITTYTYDVADRLITQTEDDVASPSPIQDLVTTFYYDDAGNQVAVKAPTDNRTTFAVTRTFYDAYGRVTKEIRNCTTSGTTVPAAPETCTGAGTKDAQTNLETTYAYDDRGNRIRLTVPDPAATTGSSTATVSTQYAFDGNDRLCRVVENATGSTNLQTLLDPCSTTTQTTTPAGTNVSTRYVYDAVGRMTSMIDGAAHTTSYAYDQLGRMTSCTDALNKTVYWKYDELGRKIRQENRSDPPSTASITWTYDGAGRQLTRTADSVTTTTTYDANGNKLTVTTGSQVITATYDRLNRPLTVDDEDAGTTADTTYTYALTSPSWTDPTGTYGVTLDKFDRATAINDPVNASDFTTSYRADGQRATFGQPNGNTTDFAYDTAGHLTGSDDDTSGGTDRAVYAWTYNRAGQVLTEASTITGDASNGTVTYTYDALGRLTNASMPGTSAAYGWDKVPNRTSLAKNGGTPELTVYDAANRPTSGTSPTAAYTSDDDGHLLTQPGQQFVWDRLGRLTQVKNGGGTVLATYSYDPLDRLRLVDYGGGNRIRFRYVGLTTSAAQWIDDVAGTVTRSIGTGWTGERLLDWTGAGSNIRIYGENAHHDVTWLATNTGTVSQALRYDPWGTPRATVPTGYTPFRFQGSWFDDTTALSWVVTRWYAPNLGRFISEDSLLGDVIDPPSRHLLAYGQGEPVGRLDPDGQYWMSIARGTTWADIAQSRLGGATRWKMLWNANRARVSSTQPSGRTAITTNCLWVPVEWFWLKSDQIRYQRKSTYCGPYAPPRSDLRGHRRELWDAQDAADLGKGSALLNFTRSELYAKTFEVTRRPARLSLSGWSDVAIRVRKWNRQARGYISRGATVREYQPRFWLVQGGDHPAWCLGNPCTLGQYVFTNNSGMPREKLSHEYIHVLQFEGRGSNFAFRYMLSVPISGSGANNGEEAVGYLWEGWISNLGRWEVSPWSVWSRPPAGAAT